MVSKFPDFDKYQLGRSGHNAIYFIRTLDFKQKYDATRMSLIDMAHSVAELEPEFILKVSCTLSAVEKKTN